MKAIQTWVGVLMVLALIGCTASPARVGPHAARASGSQIVACGQRFEIGTPVVLWSDPGGYNAYQNAAQTEGYFNSRTKGMPPGEAARIDASGWTLPLLQRRVDLVILHYDATGLSSECFRVLQARKLSSHFLLDLDGTIYQTLDLKERAWHAGRVNSRSVGIEIANVGAYPPGRDQELRRWYAKDSAGRVRVTIPADLGRGGIRARGFVAYPSRPAPITGRIQGGELVQYDFTDQQYAALIKLLAGLERVFPRVAPTAPRDRTGGVVSHVLTRPQIAAYHGLLGHYHVSREKVDPGPAFDWERVIWGVQRAPDRPKTREPGTRAR